MENKQHDVNISFEEALDRTGHGLYNYLLLSTCALTLLAIGIDMFGFSLVATAACDLNLTIPEQGILTSIPYIGILITSFFWGYISDTRGRRFTLVVPLLISFVMSCVSSLSPHWMFLAFFKFMSICFSCAANSTTYTLMGESCIQRVRGKYMLLMTCLIIFSPAVAGILAFPILKLQLSTAIPLLGIEFKPWRLLTVVLALPLGLSALALYFFYESPKFLYSIGKKEEALYVLKNMFRINHKRDKDEYQVTSISSEEIAVKKKISFPRALFEQSASLFRPPYLLRSVQLYYIVAVVYITNNSFLTWLPHIMNLVRIALESNSTSNGGVCSLISTKPETNVTETVNPEICLGTIEDNVIFTLIASQSIYSFLNFVISYLPHRKKIVLIVILSISSLSGILINLMPEPISSVMMFMTFTCTCLGMGILASYFVDLFPTSHRGMAACLSIMIGRTSTFFGINIVGNLLFYHCNVTFYVWSLLVFSSVIMACFLPPDHSLVKKYESKL